MKFNPDSDFTNLKAIIADTLCFGQDYTAYTSVIRHGFMLIVAIFDDSIYYDVIIIGNKDCSEIEVKLKVVSGFDVGGHEDVESFLAVRLLESVRLCSV